MVLAVPAIRCRQIAETDETAIAELLTRGFPDRTRAFWLHAVQQLGRRAAPAGLPRYGYMLESGGEPVGAVLMICSTVRTGDKSAIRCNLSSWYVEPAFRTYAALLTANALKHKDVTYLNVSPAPHTWPIIEAQGFARYSDGVFICLPMLSGLFAPADVSILDGRQRPPAFCEPFEEEIVRQHADLGCVSIWCVTAERAYPFVFRPRRAKKFIPYSQLVYCRDTSDFVRFAGPIGRYLAWRGKPLVVFDAKAPVPGLIGSFCRGRMPKYLKGAHAPRLGDLAYTEYAVMGV
jgi:hypothetical protein